MGFITKEELERLRATNIRLMRMRQEIESAVYYGMLSPNSAVRALDRINEALQKEKLAR